MHRMQGSLSMNRIRHKIASALALFGVLVMAPAALSQTGSASSGVDFALVGRPPSIVAVQSLQFGQFFLPATGSAASFSIVCGDDGSASLFLGTTLAAPGSPAPQCGQVTLTPGIDLSFNLRFGGTPATAVTHPGGATLSTIYSLSNASIAPPVVIITGLTDESNPTSQLPGEAGMPQDFYIGGSVTVPAGGAALGLYTGTYEILFTVVP